MSGVQGAPLVPWRGFQRPKGKGGGAPLHSRPVPETTSPESYRFAKFGDLGFLPSPFAQPFECPSLLVVSHRVPRSRQNRLVVESPLIEDVFADVAPACSFLRMYFHRVSSRHWPSPLTHQDAARITQGLLSSDKLANGKEPKEAGGGAPSR